MSKGRIKRLIADRGFGFIETTQGEDLFFHCSKLREIEFVDLHENQIVEFDVAQFPQGLQAVNVRSTGGEVGETSPDNGWSTAPTESSFPREADEPYPFEDENEQDILTQREQLFIRLAVQVTRGVEAGVREQMDAARQLGIDRATLTEVVDRVGKANADACQAVAAEDF
jgi:CspA family cold shock protein